MPPLPSSVSLHDRQVAVHIHEELGELDERARGSLERLLSDPDALDCRCRAALLDPSLTWGDGSCGEGATELYVNHHAQFGVTPPASVAPGIEAFVGAMIVHSIWVTADGDAEFLHVDYTIDAGRTQYVLSVALDRDGVIRSVRMES